VGTDFVPNSIVLVFEDGTVIPWCVRWRCSESVQSLEELLCKVKKVKRGSTLEEVGIDGSWLTASARIASVLPPGPI
jgi:hypothetical protein